MSSFGIDKAVTFRQPSTANLMIDSQDRGASFPSPWDFQITKSQSIQNGFFSRVGVTEVVLEWQIPNINRDLSNNFLNVDISGASGLVFGTNVVVTQGFYTVKELLDSLVIELNTLTSTTGSTFSVVAVEGNTYGIEINSGVWKVNMTELNRFLRFVDDVDLKVNAPLNGAPYLVPYRYLDFISDQLTYNQDLKDNSTASINRDVLCRWYMATDEPPALDAYGFPIFLGYTPFTLRRLFNPPKQIKWDSSQPLGNISFRVYDEAGDLLPPTVNASQWLMTLQLSEN
jgi:hypothetical protein